MFKYFEQRRNRKQEEKIEQEKKRVVELHEKYKDYYNQLLLIKEDSDIIAIAGFVFNEEDKTGYVRFIVGSTLKEHYNYLTLDRWEMFCFRKDFEIKRARVQYEQFKESLRRFGATIGPIQETK